MKKSEYMIKSYSLKMDLKVIIYHNYTRPYNIIFVQQILQMNRVTFFFFGMYNIYNTATSIPHVVNYIQVLNIIHVQTKGQ